MNVVLQKVIEMSLYGSIAILLVMLFRIVFRKYSKKLTLLFWVIVAVRLLCPLNFSSSLSLMNLIPSKQQTESHQTVQEEKVYKKTIKVRAQKGVSSSTVKPAKKPAPSIDPERILFVVWAGGTAVLLSYAGVRYFKVRRFVKGCRKSPDSLYLESDKTDTPFVAGVFKPHICIPSHIENNEREYLLLHEQTHIKNHDGIIKTFGFLVVCIHWFNPLVWLSYVMLCSDLEMRCDEEVIERLGKDIKKDYCRSIIMHSVREPLALPGNTAFSGFGLGALEVKMRINNLLRYKKLSKAASALVLCVAIGLTAVLTACREEITAPVVSDTSTPETTVSDETSSDETTSESEGTTSVADTEESMTNAIYDNTIEFTDEDGEYATDVSKIVEFINEGDMSDDKELASIIESLEDEGYSFTGITGNIEEDESGSKKFVVVESDGELYTVTSDEDGNVNISSEDLMIYFEDKIAGSDTIDVSEYVTSESNVVVYSVDVTGDIEDDTILNVMEEEFPVLVVQG